MKPDRIIDASANRAREALRVMEDAARFVLDDADLSERLKRLRHGLAAAIGDGTRALAWRDTPGDVGTAISTDAEHRRESVRDVVVAAAKRLTEALRSIEEYAKASAWNPDRQGGGDAQSISPATIEQLRYRAYDIEQALVLAMGSGRARQWRLCVILTEAMCIHHPWEDVARLAIDGGADCIQLREKHIDSGELLARARRLVELARPRGVAVIINDRADIALLAGADGVHVGQADLSVRDIRKLAGFDLLVGVSTTNIEQARRAMYDGADYCGIGPIFATTTKETPGGRADGSLAGPEYIRAYTAHDPPLPPHMAVGGITSDNAAEVVAAGAQGVAVSAAVCGAHDITATCRRFIAALAHDPAQSTARRAVTRGDLPIPGF